MTFQRIVLIISFVTENILPELLAIIRVLITSAGVLNTVETNPELILDNT